MHYIHNYQESERCLILFPKTELLSLGRSSLLFFLHKGAFILVPSVHFTLHTPAERFWRHCGKRNGNSQGCVCLLFLRMLWASHSLSDGNALPPARLCPPSHLRNQSTRTSDTLWIVLVGYGAMAIIPRWQFPSLSWPGEPLIPRCTKLT